MRHSDLNRFDAIAGKLMPAALLVLLTLVSVVPTPIGQGNWPDVVLIGVFVFSARVRALMPLAFVFGLGLLRDLLGAAPIGLHALIFTLVHAIAPQAAIYRQSLLRLWVGAVPAIVLAGVVSWLGIVIYYGSWPSFEPFVARCGLTIVAFPIFAGAMIWLERRWYGGP